jgi:hypothetical protein
VLSECAQLGTDDELRFPLHLLAAVASFRGGDRTRAIRELKAAHEIHGEVVAPLLSWALRSAHPDDLEERRVTLAAMKRGGRDPELYALERFGLEVGLTAHKAEATLVLDEAEPAADTDLGQALLLARALWSATGQHEAAVASLETRGEGGREIARAMAFLLERRKEEPDEPRLLELSAHWADSGSMVGALEFLGAALCNGKTEAELKARERIASELGASAAASIRASSVLVSWLTGHSPPLLATDFALSQLSNLEVAPPVSVRAGRRVAPESQPVRPPPADPHPPFFEAGRFRRAFPVPSPPET